VRGDIAAGGPDSALVGAALSRLVFGLRNPVRGIAAAEKATATHSAVRNPEMNVSGEL